MQNREKQNAWIGFVSFIMILFVLIQVFSFIPRQQSDKKNGNFWPYFYKEVPENSLDIIFMGNSHSKTTFIPEIVDKLLGTHSLHVNTSGESIYQTIYEFREVQRTQNARMIVLEANPIYAGLTKDALKPWNFSFFYAMPFSPSKFAYAHQFFLENDLVKFYLPFTSSHANWKNPDAVIKRIKETYEDLKERYKADWHVALPHQGYENYLISLPLDEPHKNDPDNMELCPAADFGKRLAVTEELLTLSEKESQNIMLIEAPQFDNPFKPCREDVISLTEKFDLPYILLLEDEHPSPLWFGDDEHMTQFGAIIASVKIAELIADKLDIAINQEMLAYYKRYFFRDYTLNQEGDQVTLALIPEDKEAVQEMIFEWNVYLNDAAILSVEETGKTELSFNMPQPSGEFFIHVVMHDPTIHYYLRGGLNYVVE